MGTKYRVYLSSTFTDLQECRKAVYGALHKLTRVEKVVAMEDYVASDQRPLDKVLVDVAECDVYVGLFAWRYGFVPTSADNPDRKSITELELRKAKELGKECLVFVLDEDADWKPRFTDTHTGENEKGARIQALRAELLDGFLASKFSDAPQLANQVSAAVSNYIATREPREPDVVDRSDAAPEFREIRHALYVAYSPIDEALAKSLAPVLGAGIDKPVRLSVEGLFASGPAGFDALDRAVTSCHAAVVLLSPGSLAQLKARTREVGAALEVMHARTGAVAAMAIGVAAAELPQEWPLDVTVEAAAPAADHAIDPPALATFKQWRDARMPPYGVRTIGVPVCVLAMRKDELAALESPADLVANRLGRPAADQYARLVKELRANAIDWTARYGTSRTAWRPFSPGGPSLGTILQDIVAALNERTLPKLKHRRLALQSYPFDPLLAADHPLRRTYRDVARAGLVIVVDEMSLFQPDLRDAFQNSPLFNNDQVAIVTISPFDPGCAPLEQLLESETRRKLAGAFDRYAVEYDPQCELAVGNERQFKRWLHASLPETVSRLQELRPNRDAIRAFFGEQLRGESTRAKGDYLWASGGRP